MRRSLTTLTLVLFLFSPGSLLADDLVFKKTKQEYQEGNKRKDRKVHLVFQDDNLVVKHRKKASVYAEIPYDSVTELIYERTGHPRVAAAVFVSPFFLFSKSKKHWFTVMYLNGDGPDGVNKDEAAYVLFQLDKKEYQQVIATAEARTGKKCERVME